MTTIPPVTDVTEPNEAAMTEPRTGYNTPIPESILTPDRVSTRIGELEFFDGLPTPDTAQRVFDHLDFIRAVEVFLNGVPAASLEGMRRGMAEAGVAAPNQVLLFDDLMDSNPLFLTGNTDTVYALVILDLQQATASRSGSSTPRRAGCSRA